MSAKTSGAVWELDLPHGDLLVLLALADHADHSGRNVRPSLGLVAWKCGYTVRQVRRIVKSLRERGILITEAKPRGRAVVYRIDLDAAPKKPPFREDDDIGKNVLGNNVTPVKMSSVKMSYTPDIAMSYTPDIAMSYTPDIAMSPEPSRTIRKNKNDDVARARENGGGGAVEFFRKHEIDEQKIAEMVAACGESLTPEFLARWDAVIKCPPPGMVTAVGTMIARLRRGELVVPRTGQRKPSAPSRNGNGNGRYVESSANQPDHYEVGPDGEEYLAYADGTPYIAEDV